MRNRIERLIILPFSIGCISQSSVAVCENNSPKLSKSQSNSSSTASREGGEEDHLDVPKPIISTSLHKMMKNFKSLSQLFVYKEEMLEEDEMEMEIGLPTDVKHVAQIGWEESENGGGKATTIIMKGCTFDNNTNDLLLNIDHPPHELFSLPHLSLNSNLANY